MVKLLIFFPVVLFLNENDFRKRIGNNISYYRKANGLTQSGLAEKLNYSDKAVSKWERGESVPDIYIIYRMSEIFSCSVNDIIGQSSEDKITEDKFNEIVRQKQFKRIMITSLSVGLLWLVAAVIYFVTDLIVNGVYNLGQNDFSLVFLYAVPSSFIITLIFSKLWGRIWQQAASVSGILWSAVISLTVSFNVFDFAEESAYKIFAAAAIFQVLIVLWYVMRKKSSKK